MPSVSGSKRCIRCDTEKALSEFYAYGYTTKQGKRSTRYESRCKPCGRARSKERHAAIRPRALAAMRQNRLDKLQERLAASREYRLSERGRRMKAKAQRMRKARIRAASDSRDPRIAALYDEATQLQAKLRACIECDDPLELQIHVDHKTPLAKGGTHTFDNLQLLTGRENVDKGVKPHSAWRGGPDAVGIGF